VTYIVAENQTTLLLEGIVLFKYSSLLMQL